LVWSGACGSHLQSQLLRRQRPEGSLFEIHPGNSSQDPISKIPSTKKDLQSGLSSRNASITNAGPEFNPQYCQKDKIMFSLLRDFSALVSILTLL
jgi:hypothetical protein